MMDIITKPWAWYVAGPIIALCMFLLVYFGKTFGVSSNLRTICSAAGAGKFSSFFAFDWKKQIWNLIFVLGTVIGGFIAHNYLTPDHAITLSESTVSKLEKMGFQNPGAEYLPPELFDLSTGSPTSILILVLGGILVGFGTRYAGGCTSGHAISGLSNLQLPSLIAVIGFFIGGLSMVYLIFPFIFK